MGARRENIPLLMKAWIPRVPAVGPALPPLEQVTSTRPVTGSGHAPTTESSLGVAAVPPL